MRTLRTKAIQLIKKIPSGILLATLIAPGPTHGASSLVDFDDVVHEVQSPKRTRGVIARADAETDANTCIDCDRAKDKRRKHHAEPAPAAVEPASATATPLDELLGVIAMHEATRPRRVARFINKRRPFRSGNVSKSMCAEAVKDVLMQAGICSQRPSGDAYPMQGSGEFDKHCGKRAERLNILDPNKAPKNSIIIYSGYAGKIPHRHGHAETKVVVTPAMKKRFGRDAVVRGAKLGQALYCSDMCRLIPTKKKTNKVVAIYQLS